MPYRTISSLSSSTKQSAYSRAQITHPLIFKSPNHQDLPDTENNNTKYFQNVIACAERSGV